MKIPVVFYPGENGWLVVECPTIQGCVSQGKTKEEALANIREAIELCIEVRKEMGWPIFNDTAEVEVAI